MAKVVSVNIPEPVPQPLPTVTLELSLVEAQYLWALLGIVGGDPEQYPAKLTNDRIYEALQESGIQAINRKERDRDWFRCSDVPEADTTALICTGFAKQAPKIPTVKHYKGHT